MKKQKETPIQKMMNEYRVLYNDYTENGNMESKEKSVVLFKSICKKIRERDK